MTEICLQTVRIMLPKKAKSQGFDLPVRPLGEKEDSIVWVFVRSTPPIAQVSFQGGPNYKDKETKGQKNTKTKQQQEEKIIRKGEEFDKLNQAGR